MPTSPDPSPADRLEAVAEELRTAAGDLLWSRQNTAPDELYRASGALVAMLGAITEISEHLSDAVAHLADDRVLRDDDGGDPAGRIAAARQHLTATATATRAATQAASDNHTTIGHLGVAPDPAMPPEPS